MGLKERKERELKAREELILHHARRLFIQDGYQGMSMDRLAEAVEYSKPTIYGHYATKEDLLLAVANEALRKRVELFLRAGTLRGNPRERMTAVGAADLVFVHAFTEHYEIERLVKSESLWQKASPQRHQEHMQTGIMCMNAMSGLVGMAIAAGDFDPKASNPWAVAEGLRAMSMGTHMIAPVLFHSEQQRVEIYTILRRNQQLFLDGCGWRPLSSEHDYDSVMARAFREVFPEESDAVPAALRLIGDAAPHPK